MRFALHRLLPAPYVAPVEMDPLSVTASVVGLRTAAQQVAAILCKVRSGIVDAPRLADQLLSQVKELEICLSSLHKLLARIKSAPTRRISMIQVDQLVATLTEAVLTFSELDALLTPLETGCEASIRQRLKLAWKEDTISNILTRLDRHKSSLSLMLTIVQWYIYEFYSSDRYTVPRFEY